MPINGIESNIQNIDNKTLQDFEDLNMTLNKTIVVGNGIRNHEEFLYLVNETFEKFNSSQDVFWKREISKYHGGENKIFKKTTQSNIIIAYESVSWTHKLMHTFAIMNIMFGSAQGFSIGGPGKGMLNRAHTNILKSKYYISNCSSINFHFSDSGLFGFNFTGNSSNGREIVYDIIECFISFSRKIDDNELIRSKNILKRQFLSGLMNQGDRLEDTARSVKKI